MSKPYDATAKDLLQSDPAAWAAFFGVVRAANLVEIIDSDLSTITAAADRVLRINDESPWLINVEFQSHRDLSLPRRMLKYNGILQDRHDLAVASVLVLLTQDADSPAYNGRLKVDPPLGPSWEFRYSVIRVWELSAEDLLTGPLVLLPLAPVADVEREAVPAILGRVEERLDREADSEAGSRLMIAISKLLQLRYGPMVFAELLKKFPELHEFGLTKASFDKGQEQGREEGRGEGQRIALRRSILRVGTKKFGTPAPEREAALLAIADEPRLEALTEKLLDVDSWDALLRDA